MTSKTKATGVSRISALTIESEIDFGCGYGCYGYGYGDDVAHSYFLVIETGTETGTVIGTDVAANSSVDGVAVRVCARQSQSVFCQCDQIAEIPALCSSRIHELQKDEYQK